MGMEDFDSLQLEFESVLSSVVVSLYFSDGRQCGNGRSGFYSAGVGKFTVQCCGNTKTRGSQKVSVSNPYSLNPDLDPAKNLNLDPENPRIRILAISS